MPYSKSLEQELLGRLAGYLQQNRVESGRPQMIQEIQCILKFLRLLLKHHSFFFLFHAFFISYVN